MKSRLMRQGGGRKRKGPGIGLNQGLLRPTKFAISEADAPVYPRTEFPPALVVCAVTRFPVAPAALGSCEGSRRMSSIILHLSAVVTTFVMS